MKYEVMKAKRELKKLTLRQLSLITGLSHSYLSLLEQGKRVNPTLDTLDKICKALDINLKEELI